MAEYIEREKAFKLIKEQKEKETGAYSKGRNKGLIIAGSIINNKEVLPTADVVEVKCRCKDCRYTRIMSDGKSLACIRQSAYRLPDDFCSYGERKK